MAYYERDDDSFTAQDRKHLVGPDKRAERRRLAEERRNNKIDAQNALASQATTGNTGLGALNYQSTQAGYSADRLPEVADPEATLADVAQSQHERFIRNFRDYETALLGARDDTSLIDAAPEAAATQTQLAEDIARRNRERYGYQETGAEEAERRRATQRVAALNLAGGINNARLAQRDINQGLLGNLFNIGQGVYKSSLSGLGDASQMQAQRNMAFSNAKTAYKQQSIGFLGKIGSAIASIF